MRCTSCGHSSAFHQDFCDNCGAPLLSEQPRASRGLTLLAGLALIISGVLMMTLPLVESFITVTVSTTVARMGSDQISAFSILRSVCNSLLSPLFLLIQYMPLVAGIALLLRRPGAGRAAITALVIQLLVVIGAFFVQIICWFMPAMPLLHAIFGVSNDVVRGMQRLPAGANIASWYPLVVSALTAVCFVVSLVCVLLLIKKRGNLFGKMPRGVFAMLVGVILYAIPSIVTDLLSAKLFSDFQGYEAITANNTINSIYFTLPILPAVLCFFLCMFLWKKSFAISALPLCLLAIVGNIASLILSYVLLPIYNTPEPILGMVQSGLAWRAIGTCAFQIGLIFWVAASARGNLPLWVQLPLGLLLPVAYLCTEWFKYVFRLRFYLPVGNVAAGLLLVTVCTICVFTIKSDIHREQLRT